MRRTLIAATAIATLAVGAAPAGATTTRPTGSNWGAAHHPTGQPWGAAHHPTGTDWGAAHHRRPAGTSHLLRFRGPGRI